MVSDKINNMSAISFRDGLEKDGNREAKKMKKISEFDKEGFKKEVVNNVKNLFRKTIDEATDQQVFQAVAYAVKDDIIDRWIATHKEYEKQNVKTVYYLSMEFLMGRALGNNLINLTYYNEVKTALDELGFDINVIEDQEPDAALGNGGLGRLAACFVDSLTTMDLPAYGCSIRYEHGLFRQKIVEGYQTELPDEWLENGNAWEISRPEEAVKVVFGGQIECNWVDGQMVFNYKNAHTVLAMPYDVPLVGYDSKIVNKLRLWGATIPTDVDMINYDRDTFNRMMEDKNLADRKSVV